MTNINTPDVGTALIIARSVAIQAFSNLEQSLCYLFINCAEVDAGVGGLIFFKINNQRTRNSIIEKLLKRKFGPEFSPFWRSAFKICGVLAERRNEIVHWQVLTTQAIKDGTLDLSATPNDAQLVPSNIWWRDDNTPALGVEDLLLFERNCAYIARLINIFQSHLMTENNLPDEKREPWLQRFREPIPYPPPEGHPLYETPGVWNTQPQS